MKTRKTYRSCFRPLIAKVKAENAGRTVTELRAALREAFPFGIRKYWPYKVWLSEIRRQLRIPWNRSVLDSTPLFEGVE